MGDIELTGRLWHVPGKNFKAELGFRDGVPVLALDGEIDVYTFPTLLEAMEEVITDGHKHLVIDLHKVDFLDSGGISVLIKIHKVLQGMSGRLDLERVHGHTYRVLEITGLTDILNVKNPDHDLAA